LYLFVRRVIKKVVELQRHVNFVNYIQNFIQQPPVKFNSICRKNYWGSPVWISKQEVRYWSYTLHASNTWDKMVIKRNSASTIYWLLESLWFC
jgi:hypothetical protein